MILQNNGGTIMPIHPFNEMGFQKKDQSLFGGLFVHHRGLIPSAHKHSALATKTSQSFCLYSSTRTDDTIPTDVPNDTEDDSSSAESYTFDWNAQWYPIIPFSYLSDKPVSLTVMGKPLVIWKEQGDKNMAVSVFHDSCPHRMAPLSIGTIVQAEDGGESSNTSPSCRLKCRFHGWEFESNGACSRMPMLTEQEQKAMNESSSSGSSRLFSPEVFHTRIEKGLVWAFLDSSIPKDDLPDIPEDCLPTMDVGPDWIFDIHPVSYQSMVENSFDPAHAPFTHEGAIGFGEVAFSPKDALPMSKYNIKNYDHNGFELSHTPYERSTAERLVSIL